VKQIRGTAVNGDGKKEVQETGIKRRWVYHLKIGGEIDRQRKAARS